MNAPLPRFAPPAAAIATPAGLWDADCLVPSSHAALDSETLVALHRASGVERAVVTERLVGAAEGREALLEQLSQGQGRYRGVVRLQWSDGPNVIDYLHEMGVRGVRVDLSGNPRKPWDEAELQRISELIAPFSWSMSMPLWSRSPERQLAVLKKLRVPVILDSGCYRDIAMLLKRRAWTSGNQIWLRMTGVLDAPVDDERDDFFARHKERLLWGSGAAMDARSDAKSYRDALSRTLDAMPDANVQGAIFVDNPTGLFDC